MRIVDVRATHIGSGGCYATPSWHHSLDDFLLVEWIANADRPVIALSIHAAALDVSPGIDEEI